jgi:hypothetical protein
VKARWEETQVNAQQQRANLGHHQWWYGDSAGRDATSGKCRRYEERSATCCFYPGWSFALAQIRIFAEGVGLAASRSARRKYGHQGSRHFLGDFEDGDLGCVGVVEILDLDEMPTLAELDQNDGDGKQCSVVTGDLPGILK